MSATSNKWTLDGFVNHFDFVHHKMLDHKFVWVLGAGASLASGIPLGSTLVDQWLKELHLREEGEATPLEKWATEQNLGIKGFKYADRAKDYAGVYQRRFHDYPDEGYAYLESVMSGKDPSPGYSILAAAMAADPPRHNAVITTNFDNLVADALSIYTDTFPFVCGHESLTGFVRVAMRRPLICKIHRDLLLAPQNDPRSLRRLHDAWGGALRALFEHYTPLFIGYGGNDDTLMDLLESLEPGDIKGQMIWCYYEGSNPDEKSKPDDRIVNLITDHDGVLVPVPDFDLLMVLLGEKMGIGLLDEDINRRARARTKRYRERIQLLDTEKHPAVAQARAATMERSGGWWAWEQKARRESDLELREIAYRQGLQHYPQSAELHHNFANFLSEILGNAQEAEEHFRSAIELGSYANHRVNLAFHLWKVGGNGDEVEKFYRQAIELDPKKAATKGDLAAFLFTVRGNLDEAEHLFQQAIEDDPDNANNYGNYAALLLGKGQLAEADEKLEQSGLLNGGKKNQLAAELALYASILASARSEDVTEALRELEMLFSSGFGRLLGNFDQVLVFVRSRLSPEDYTLYSSLAAAILDDKKVGEAEKLLRSRLAAVGAQEDKTQSVSRSGAKKVESKRSNKRPRSKTRGNKKPRRSGTSGA